VQLLMPWLPLVWAARSLGGSGAPGQGGSAHWFLPMKTFQQILVCALLSALTALVVCTILLLRAATATVAAIPGEVQATRRELIGVVEAVRKDLTAQVENRPPGCADALRAAVGGGSRGRNRRGCRDPEMADRRLGDTLARADTALGTWKRCAWTSNRCSTIPPPSPRR